MDDFQMKMSVNIASEVFKLALKGLLDTGKSLIEKGKENEIIRIAANNYIEKMEYKYDNMRIMGMDKPISIRDVFVRINILEKITSRQRVSVKYLEEKFDRDNFGFGQNVYTESGDELLKYDIYRIANYILKKLQSENLSIAGSNCLALLKKQEFKGKDKFISTVKQSFIDESSNRIVKKYPKFKKKEDYQKEVALKEFEKYKNRIIELCRSDPKYIILGKPGSGKTTFLKFLVLQALDGKTEKKPIPIFITLKDFADANTSLIDFIVRQFSNCDFPDPVLFITKMLETGRCLVLLDGLDEVPQIHEEYVIKEIRELSDKYNKNQYLLSCRIAAYNHWFERFLDLELADFDKKQIKNFIGNWFGIGSKIANSCWDKLNENIHILELGNNPLLLTLLCIAFEQTLDFPGSRAELYKEAIDALLKKWDATRRIKRDQIYRHLSVKKKESLFTRIAIQTFEKDEYFITKHSLEKYIIEFIKHLPELDINKIEENSEVIRNSIEKQHGIFVQRAKGIYSFSHLTFQEYFTAKYIVDNAGMGTLDNLVDKYIFEDKWREVFLLVINLLDIADDVVQSMLKKIENIIEEQNLTPFLNIAKRIRKQTDLYTNAYTQILSILFLLNFTQQHRASLPHCISVANSLVTRRIDKNKVSKLRAIQSADNLNMVGNNAPLYIGSEGRIIVKEEHNHHQRDLNFALQNEILLTRYIDSNKTHSLAFIDVAYSLNFSDREFIKFLKATLLLYECLETDCYISTDMREKILSSLFIAPLES